MCKPCYIQWFHPYNNEALFIYALDIFNFKGCPGCGEKDLRCIQFDHNYRKKHTPHNFSTSYQLYRWMIANPEKARKYFTPMCSNCNWRKRWVNQECK